MSMCVLISSHILLVLIIFQAASVFQPPGGGLLQPSSWYPPHFQNQFQLPENAALFPAQPSYKPGGGGRGSHSQYKNRRGRGGGGLSNDRGGGGSQGNEQRGNGYNTSGGGGPNTGFQPQGPSQYPGHPQAAPSPPQAQYNANNYYYGGGGAQQQSRSGGRSSMDGGNIKKYQNNGVLNAASVPSTSPHFNLQQSQQLAQQPGAGMPSTQINNVVAAAVAATVAAAAPTIPASVTTASVAASSVTPMVSATVPVVSAHAGSSNDNLTKAATDATPTASINPEATTPSSQQNTNQYQNHPQHRHNQRDDNYNSGFSYPRAPMESIQGGKEMQK